MINEKKIKIAKLKQKFCFVLLFTLIIVLIWFLFGIFFWILVLFLFFVFVLFLFYKRKSATDREFWASVDRLFMVIEWYKEEDTRVYMQFHSEKKILF